MTLALETRSEHLSKLQKAIDRYIKADTTRKQSGAKGAITKLINNRAIAIGASKARAELWDFFNKIEVESYSLPTWMSLRFTPGSLYEEGDRLMGWWDDGQIQVQAEEIPLFRSNDTYVVSFHCRPEFAHLWHQRGFEPAEPLPIRYGEWKIDYVGSWAEVDFPVRRSPLMAEYGYALPCPLQWHRDWQGLHVDRSIIEHGFSQAWKWWGENTKWWYLEHRPELFADLDWWGQPEPKRYEPIGDPYAAVRGGGFTSK